MKPNASRKYCRNESWSLVSFVGLLRLLPRRSAPACSAAAPSGSGRRAPSSTTPGFARDVDLVELALLVEQRLRGRQVEDRERRAAERGRRCRTRRSRLILNGCSLPAARDDADGLPDLEVLLEAVFSSIADLVRPVRPGAGDERERVEALVARSVDAEGEARARRRAATTLPFRPTNCAWSPTPPTASATSGRALTRASVDSGNDGAFCEPPKTSLPVTTASTFEYAVGEDRVEAGVDRVGEDEGAAHHRDAHHDRERGQDQPELAPEQILERDPDHDAAARRSSSFIVFSTSAAVAPLLVEHDQPVGEVEDPVGDRGGARVVGDHHDRLPVGVARVAEQLRGSRRSSASRGCRSARRRRRRSAARRASARPRRAAAGRRRARSGGA